jgi:hypothetical protein
MLLTAPLRSLVDHWPRMHAPSHHPARSPQRALQGEEADLVIACMVRSNARGQLGFLGKDDAEQRVNVLCTRARLGFIVLGNARCLEKAPLWARLLTYMRDRRFVYPGLPVKCERHHVLREPSQLQAAESVRQMIASGCGCESPCEAVFECGHHCQLLCHPWDHGEVSCSRAVRVDCRAGLHRVDRACAAKAAPSCTHDVLESCDAGHPTVRPCWQAELQCRVCEVLRGAASAEAAGAAAHARAEAELIAEMAGKALEPSAATLTDGQLLPAALHEEARARLEALAHDFEEGKREQQQLCAAQLDAAERHAQAAMEAAIDRLNSHRRADVERLEARRAHTEQELQRVEARLAQQRTAAQAAAEEDLRARDAQLEALHRAVQIELQADELAFRQAAAARPAPEDVAKQLDELRATALREQCTICLDDHPVFEGVLCKSVGGHFVCDECFGAHVVAEASKPAFKDDIRCPCASEAMGGCQSGPYATLDVARHARPEAFEALNKKRLELREGRVAAMMENDFEKRLSTKIAELKLSAEAAEYALARSHIADNILTLRCPRCGQAFDSFDGCFALTCLRQGCACGFCAWCLADCGKDAHTHVRSCPSNKRGDLYGSEHEFERHHAERKLEALRAYIEEKVRRELQQRIREAFKAEMLELEKQFV